MKKRFWNWIKNNSGRSLYLNGPIAEDSWFGDEVTPTQFKNELFSQEGDVTVWINSPGGDVFAASQIYNMLKDYPGNTKIIIDGIAASAASVIAMSGDDVQISPTGLMMIHNPMTFAYGDSDEMKKAITMLSEVKEAIINAYESKTGISRTKLSHMMDAESWFNANKAVELGFADSIMFQENTLMAPKDEGVIFSRMAVTNSILEKLQQKQNDSEKKTPIEQLQKRLEILKL